MFIILKADTWPLIGWLHHCNYAHTHRHTQPPACWWSSSPRMKLNLVLMKSSSPAASFTIITLPPSILAHSHPGWIHTDFHCVEKKKRSSSHSFQWGSVFNTAGGDTVGGLYQSDAAPCGKQVNFFLKMLTWPITDTQSHISLISPQARNQILACDWLTQHFAGWCFVVLQKKFFSAHHSVRPPVVSVCAVLNIPLPPPPPLKWTWRAVFVLK